MDLTTPVTMDQVVKERERKERVGRGRNGQTTSLDEIEPLEPQRAHHARPGGQPTHLHLPLAHYRSLPLPLQAAGCPGTALHCPVLHTGGPNWTGYWLAGWLADWGGA